MSMNQIVEQFNPRPDDIVVIPDHMDIPENPGFLVIKVKFLHAPSIIRSGGGIQMLESTLMNKPAAGSKLSPILGWILDKVAPVLNVQTESKGTTMDTVVDNIETKANPPRFLRHIRMAYVGDDDTEMFAARGGLSIAVELEPNEGILRFSYALCSPNDVFNKRTARKICDARLTGKDSYEITNYDDRMTALENIEFAIGKHLTSAFEASTIELPKLDKMSSRADRQELAKVHKMLTEYLSIETESTETI